MYRVFLGAPTARELKLAANRDVEYKWSTLTAEPGDISFNESLEDEGQSTSVDDIPLPKTALDAATERISLLYQNVIFDGDGEDNEPDPVGWQSADLEESLAQNESFASWNGGGGDITRETTRRESLSRFETQETSYGDYSEEGSSIINFPKFHFSVSTIVPLSHLKLISSRPTFLTEKPPPIPGLLVAVLEVTGPDVLTLRKGPDAGKEIHILKLILGDKDGVCKLTAWRDTAKDWGEGDAVLKRGDIVYLQNTAFASPSDRESLAGGTALTASPFLKSTMQICYRCLNSLPEDRRYRPDLRLAEIGIGDPCVKAVKVLVDWFEKTAGLKNKNGR